MTLITYINFETLHLPIRMKGKLLGIPNDRLDLRAHTEPRRRLYAALAATMTILVALVMSLTTVQAANAAGGPAVSWSYANGSYTLTLPDSDPWEVKQIVPSQHIFCGTNYGNPCASTTYTYEATPGTCVMVQVDWDGRHGYNSDDYTFCAPTTPEEEPPVVVTPPVTPEEPPVVVVPPVTPEEPPLPQCIDQSDWSYTYEASTGSGVVTVTSDQEAQSDELCDSLAVRASSWKYDVSESGATQWPQTLNGSNDLLVDTLGSFNYAVPGLESCYQYDIYAQWTSKGGFDELGLPTTLYGPGNPYEPPFLHDVLSGKGPNPTHTVTSTEGCSLPPVTPPVTPEEPTTPTIIDEYEPVRGEDNCGVDNDHLDVPRDTYALTYTKTNDTRVDGVGSVTYEVTGKSEFALPKGVETSWTHEFTNEACETTPPTETPEPPVVTPPVVTPPTETPEPPVVTPPTETPEPPVVVPPTETPKPPVVTPPVTPPVTPEEPTTPVVTPPTEGPKPSPEPTEKPEPSPEPSETPIPSVVTPEPTSTPIAAVVVNPPVETPAKVVKVSASAPKALAETGFDAGTAGLWGALLLMAGMFTVVGGAANRRRRKVTNE